MRTLRLSIMLAAVLCLQAPATSQAAKRCGVPSGDWQRATPQQAGMDAARLQDALDYGTSQLGLAVRVYRHGCLVGRDRAAGINDGMRFESWSLGKSVTSMLFGRAMTERTISPDDRVGSLLPEADRAHGKVRMADLLTMTSGVHWNGFRDYNIFTQTDRVRDWLTLKMDHEPGTFFEYAQSAVAIVPKMVESATGDDPRAYIQRELLDPLGIGAGSWEWQRDQAGNIEGFWGVRMRVDDFGRLGELMRRGGRWGGERLLSKEYVRRALTGSKTNGCYGWLIWTNDAKPCIGPRIASRDVVDEYGYPGTPRDGFVFSGLFGQIVAVFPSQGIVIVRTGHDSNASFAGGANWQIELFRRVLRAIVDEPVELPDDSPGSPIESSDEGFQHAIFDPGQYSQGAVPDPLPPPGPARARAAILAQGGKGVRGRRAFVRLHCPAAVEGAVRGCRGKLGAKGAKRRRYSVAAGESQRLGLKLRGKIVRRLTRRGRIGLEVRARNRDRAGGVPSRKRFRFEDAAKRSRRGF
jgi:CubicO group peptidase (beta-lactamase class C family)